MCMFECVCVRERARLTVCVCVCACLRACVCLSVSPSRTPPPSLNVTLAMWKGTSSRAYLRVVAKHLKCSCLRNDIVASAPDLRMCGRRRFFIFFFFFFFLSSGL